MNHDHAEVTIDPAAELLIADLRRRLDEVGVLADLSAVRQAEAETLRRRLDAVLAARRFEVDALRRRIGELEALVLAEHRAPAADQPSGEAPVTDPGDAAAYSRLAAGFRERLAERTAELERRYEDRLREQRLALEEKDERIRALATQLAAARRDAEGLGTAGAPARPVDPHDLEQIRGIGPVLAAFLRSHGVATIGDIAGLGDAELDRLDGELEAFHGRSRRDRWVEQARALLEGDDGRQAHAVERR